MKGNRIITIGRQIGSGGSEIGMEVAKRLGIQCYDRQLIEMACDYGELDQDILAEAEEKRPNPFLYSVPRQMQNDKTGRGIAINDMVFNLQSEVIRRLAEKESCVIIGRCADYVLRQQPGMLSVFIHAPLEQRVLRVARLYNIDEDKARARIRKTDKTRANYYNYYADGDWGRADRYDIALNTGKLPIPIAAQLLADAAKLVK